MGMLGNGLRSRDTENHGISFANEGNKTKSNIQATKESQVTYVHGKEVYVQHINEDSDNDTEVTYRDLKRRRLGQVRAQEDVTKMVMRFSNSHGPNPKNKLSTGVARETHQTQ